ncbi:heterokaryon incompatibility protein-domain-containing protein [Hypomontagnella monticulosa]|nr:heterokaryon incompatibility protein-domain-containing protein [Hypomontagnella monticulosa]
MHITRNRNAAQARCGLCDALVNALRMAHASFNGSEEYNYGDPLGAHFVPHNEMFGYTYADCQTKGCSGLRELTNECLKLLGTERQREGGTELVLVDEPIPAEVDDPPVFAPSIAFRTKEPTSIRFSGVQLALVRGTNRLGDQASGRILNSSWVDIAQVKQWKQRCISHHGQKCDNPLMLKKIEPALLIDTQTNALVNGMGRGPYVTLSYRWGKTKRLKNMSANSHRLLRPGVLLEESSSISPIVLDAMRLVKEIGERYLWVDALCIVQDNKELRTPQLKLMGEFYANSVITIVATDGDAEYGLPGVPGGIRANPRNLKQPVYTLCGGEKIIQMNIRRHKRKTSKVDSYYNRGWTYQEFQMASRRLIFEDNMVYWECSCTEWHEYSTTEKQQNLPLGPIMKGFCDFEAYNELVRAYNERHFTLEEDVLPAIDGMLAAFSRSFTGGFLYGLPEMFFDIALSWRPYDWPSEEKQTLTRRRVSPDPVDPSLRLPSWSWVGWRGPISAIPYHMESFWSRIHPTTEWYAGDTPEPYKGRRINSCWYEQKEIFKDLDQPLPAGWRKHSIVQENEERRKKGRPMKRGRDYFTHDFAVDRFGRKREFWHPWPVTPITVSSEPNFPAQSPYISCRTKRAWVKAHKHTFGDSSMILLRDSGSHIGDLFLPNTGDDGAQFSDDESVGLLVELVIVCRKVGRGAFGDYNNVLWIEWNDEKSVAYRKASGEVNKRWWDRHAKAEDIDLVLG